MPTKDELFKAIDEVSKLPDTYSKCQKLATFYILLNSLYPEEDFKNGISTQFQITNTEFGNSEFLQKIKGHDINKVLSVLDELMEALKALNPQLYANTLRRFEWTKRQVKHLPFRMKKIQKILKKLLAKLSQSVIIKM